jgi:hypothetical protein
MIRLLKNILLFFVAIVLLLTVGGFGLVYTVFDSIINIRKISFFKYWGDIVYTINVGVDKIGNVLLGKFLNEFAVTKVEYPFGSINDTISYALAKNIGNLTSLGRFIVDVLEYLDPGHMEKSIKERI